MKKLGVDQVLKLHSLIIEQSSGIGGVRDSGLLDSSLNTPFQTFDNEESYPSIQEKAARLCYSIINNHPFIDGNKRIGILVTLVFLKINNIVIICRDEDIIDLGLGVASGKYGLLYIIEWIARYSQN